MQILEKNVLSGGPFAAVSYRLLLPLLADAISGTADVLHIGCGAGRTTAAMAHSFPQWRITALDSDPALFAKAFHRLAGGIRVTRADPPQLPYADESFDLVIAAFVWHRLPEWQMVTTQTHRVLRPGGALLLADAVMPQVTSRHSNGRRPTLTEVKVALSIAGFALTRCTEVAGLYYRILAHKQHRRR